MEAGFNWVRGTSAKGELPRWLWCGTGWTSLRQGLSQGIQVSLQSWTRCSVSSLPALRCGDSRSYTKWGFFPFVKKIFNYENFELFKVKRQDFFCYCVHSFNKHVSCIYYDSVIVLDGRNVKVSKTNKNPCLQILDTVFKMFVFPYLPSWWWCEMAGEGILCYAWGS